MSVIKYHYAYNEDDVIVDIDDFSSEYRKERHFHCISCNAEMIAKRGNKNSHHFAHKAGENSCSSETYLHKLGKLMLKKKFEESSSFVIKYRRIVQCVNSKSCPFYKGNECYEKKFDSFDLKEFYDTCSEEQTIGEYKADLLLSDSRNRHKKPVLIEIQVTHESTLQKQKSGEKIIEIRIKSDDDIKTLVNNDIKECKNVKFLEFIRESNVQRKLSKRHLFRFFLYNNGAAYVSNYEDMPRCSEGLMNPNAILELNLDCDYFSACDCGYIAAIKMGYDIKNCQLCKYHRSGFESTKNPIFCCMSKEYGTPKYPKSTYANQCQYYRIDKERIFELKNLFSKIAYQKIE